MRLAEDVSESLIVHFSCLHKSLHWKRLAAYGTTSLVELLAGLIARWQGQVKWGYVKDALPLVKDILQRGNTVLKSSLQLYGFLLLTRRIRGRELR